MERGLSSGWTLAEIAAVAGVLAPAMSEGRRGCAQPVAGSRAAFGTDLCTIYLPVAPPLPPGMSPIRVLTAGIALQASPTKEMLCQLDLSTLGPRERRAVRLVEGCAAMEWAARQWSRLRGDLRVLVPGQVPRAVSGPKELLECAYELACGDLVLDVPELFGVLPGTRPLSGHRERMVADGRRRNRVPWTNRRTLRRMTPAMPVGGSDGEMASLARVEEGPESEETSDADRRIGIPYPEWDHRLQRYRGDHVTVIERRLPPVPGGGVRVDPRIRRWFAAPHAVTWRGRLEVGDQIDVSAYVESYGHVRAGGTPEDRVYQALSPRRRDVATALLLDATSSLQARGGARFRTQLACCEALCAALGSTGERFAVFAFTGETRHRVELVRLRDFADPPWLLPSGTSIRPSGYTRLGAALRHVTSRLTVARAERRVLLSVGDGIPSDEGYEGAYAEADVRRAVDEALAVGVGTHHLAVGQAPVERLESCFGAERYHRVSRPDDLPRILARIHRELTEP